MKELRIKRFVIVTMGCIAEDDYAFVYKQTFAGVNVDNVKLMKENPDISDVAYDKFPVVLIYADLSPEEMSQFYMQTIGPEDMLELAGLQGQIPQKEEEDNEDKS